jgi:hypothetical protein
MEEQGGVPHAMAHKQELRQHGIAPDILSDIDLEVLKHAGINHDDSVRITKQSCQWWLDEKACKRLRPMQELSRPHSPAQKPDVRIMYKLVQDGGDGQTFYPSGCLIEGGPQSDEDKHTLYWDEARGGYQPIPNGWVTPGPIGTNQSKREREQENEWLNRR